MIKLTARHKYSGEVRDFYFDSKEEAMKANPYFFDWLEVEYVRE